MPQLPTFSDLGDSSIPTPVLPRRTPQVAYLPASSGMEGASSQELDVGAQHLSAAANYAMQIQDQQDQLRANDANNKLTQARIDMTYGPDGFTQQKGANAVNTPLLKTYGDKFDAVAASLSAGLDNDYQRKMLAQRAGIQGLQLRQGLVKHIALQSDDYARTSFIEGNKADISAAAADPSETKLSLVNIDNRIDTMASRLGLEKTDFVKNERAAARNELYTSQIDTLLPTNPTLAQSLLNTPEIWNSLSDKNRPILSARVSQAVMVNGTASTAKNWVSEALSNLPTQLAQSRAPIPTGTPTEGQTTIATSAGTKIDPALQRQRDFDRLRILREEAANDPNDKALQSELAAQETALGSGTQPVSSNQQLPPNTTGMPTAKDVATLRPMLVAKVEPELDRLFGPDKNNAQRIQYGQHLINAIDSQVNNEVGNLRAVQVQAQSIAQDDINKNNITDIQQIYSDPQRYQNWNRIGPDGQAVLTTQILRKAANGDKDPGDPVRAREVWNRINVLPAGDPNKIYLREQLMNPETVGHMNIKQMEDLQKEIDKPDLPINQQIKEAKITADKTLNAAYGSLGTVSSTHSELIADASMRYKSWVDQQVKAVTGAGGNPMELFDPNKPDKYVASPNRIMSFFPSEAQIKAAQAARIAPQTATNVVPRNPGESPADYLKRVGK